MIIQNSRIQIKRSTVTTVIPTVAPSLDHTDGSWSATDIYKGEFFKNLVDGKLWTRFDSGIVEVTTQNSGHFWKPTGNTLTSRGIFGSISGSWGWDEKINNVVIGSVQNNGFRVFGQSSPFTSTYFSIKSPGTDSSSFAWQAFNSDGTPVKLAWLRDDGAFNTKTGQYYVDDVLHINIDKTNINIGFLTNANNGATGTNNIAAGNAANLNGAGSFKVLFGTECGRSSDSDELNAFGKGTAFGYNGDNSTLFDTDAGKDGVGNFWFGGGFANLQDATGSHKFAMGLYAGRLNTDSNVAIFGPYYNFYFNYDIARDSLSTSLNTVTLQTAGSKNATDESAATSILKLAQAKGRGTGAGGSIVIQKSVPTVSGTTQHTLADWWYFQNDGIFYSKGDMEFEDPAGIILTDQTLTTRHRITLDNGVLVVSGAL